MIFGYSVAIPFPSCSPSADTVELPASTLLSDLDLVPTKVLVSQPIEMRLEAMVVDLMRRARDLGEITRGEVVGTLLLGGHVDDSLVRELRNYRDTATAGDAVPGSKTIALPPRRRGRPSRRS
jgi:hypothetical protein